MSDRNEFIGWRFFEEMKDKVRGISHGSLLAVKIGSDVRLNDEPCVLGIAQQPNRRYKQQSIAVQYLYDYCTSVTQHYAATHGSHLWVWMKQKGYPMHKVRIHISHREGD